MIKRNETCSNRQFTKQPDWLALPQPNINCKKLISKIKLHGRVTCLNHVAFKLNAEEGTVDEILYLRSQIY